MELFFDGYCLGGFFLIYERKNIFKNTSVSASHDVADIPIGQVFNRLGEFAKLPLKDISLQYLFLHALFQSPKPLRFNRLCHRGNQLAWLGSLINLIYTFIIQNRLELMDVSLDDLIQKDRKQPKTQLKGKKTKPVFKTKGIVHRQQNGRPRAQRGGLRPNNLGNRNPPRQFEKRNDGQKFQNKMDNRRVPVKREKSPQKRKEVVEAQKQEKGRTLRVLGLHPDITNEDLYKLFAAEGALEKCMIEQDNFGRNLPSALVKYYSADNAKQSISNLNGKKVMNSVLTVEPYRRAP